MHCLHLANDYSGSTVYSNLIMELDKRGVDQTVYTPLRDKSKIGVNQIQLKRIDSKFIYRPILNFYSRLNYKYKIKTVFRDVNENVDLSKINLIHAHTWYSDGGVAYELFKKLGVPYVVTIRNTDLAIFFKYLVHVRRYALEILRHAKHVIFITPVLYNKLFRSKLLVGLQALKQKSIILPNGIDQFWISNIVNRKSKISNPLELIYVGNFNKGKKVDKIILAVNILNRSHNPCHLTIVGGGGQLEKKINRNIQRNREYYTYLGKIKDKRRLASLLQASDIFVMPSKNETFGLVYIEALSQGIPVVYGRNYGIDGMHSHNIGEAADGDNVEEIVKAITKIACNYQSYNFIPQSVVQEHNWKKISEKYLHIYEQTAE